MTTVSSFSEALFSDLTSVSFLLSSLTSSLFSFFVTSFFTVSLAFSFLVFVLVVSPNICLEIVSSDSTSLISAAVAEKLSNSPAKIINLLNY